MRCRKTEELEKKKPALVRDGSLLTRVAQDGRVGSRPLLSGLSGFRLWPKVSVDGDLHWFVVYGEIVGHFVAEGLIRYLKIRVLNCGLFVAGRFTLLRVDGWVCEL